MSHSWCGTPLLLALIDQPVQRASILGTSVFLASEAEELVENLVKAGWSYAEISGHLESVYPSIQRGFQPEV